jgi:hypothetical protein
MPRADGVENPGYSDSCQRLNTGAPISGQLARLGFRSFSMNANHRAFSRLSGGFSLGAGNSIAAHEVTDDSLSLAKDFLSTPQCSSGPNPEQASSCAGREDKASAGQYNATEKGAAARRPEFISKRTDQPHRVHFTLRRPGSAPRCLVLFYGAVQPAPSIYPPLSVLSTRHDRYSCDRTTYARLLSGGGLLTP